MSSSFFSLFKLFAYHLDKIIAKKIYMCYNIYNKIILGGDYEKEFKKTSKFKCNYGILTI